MDSSTITTVFDCMTNQAWTICLGCAIVAYFLGNISPAHLLASQAGIDIKSVGSGNAGTTNVLRALGPKAASVTFIIDAFKGMAAVFVGLIAGIMLLTEEQAYVIGQICALAVLIGHIFPVAYKFEGGKGVATAFGAITSLDPYIGVSLLAIFIIMVWLTKQVSIGSLLAAMAFPPLINVFMPEFMLIGLVIAIMIIVVHWENIKRLIKKQENTIDLRRHR